MKLNLTHHHHPCIHLRPGGECLEGMMPAALEAALVHSESGRRFYHHPHPDQSTSAIIYVAIVVVFYSAIIIILVGTTIRRRRNMQENSEDTSHLLLYDEGTRRVHQSKALTATKIEDAGLVTV